MLDQDYHGLDNKTLLAILPPLTTKNDPDPTTPNHSPETVAQIKGTRVRITLRSVFDFVRRRFH